MMNLFFFTFILFSVFSCASLSHPFSMALLLMLISVSFSVLLLKLSFSWFFFSLILMFLGGIMIIVIYMTSLAANEKFKLGVFSSNFFPSLIIFFLGIFNETLPAKNFSSINFLAPTYEILGSETIILSFFFLLAALFSVVKLMKLEKGPLVKRL